MKTRALLHKDDEQLEIEMRAMAELLLDIYEHRMREARLKRAHSAAILDSDRRDRTIKERSIDNEK
jgi:hypothetical protein